MKYNLKKLSILITAIFTIFSSNVIVNAEECKKADGSCRVTAEGVIKYGSGKSGTKGTKTNNGGLITYSSSGITFKGSKKSNPAWQKYNIGYLSTSKTAYCLDPNLEGNSELYAQRFLFSPKVTDKKTLAMDAALYTILTNGGDAAALQIAIRATVITFNNHLDDEGVGSLAAGDDERESANALVKALRYTIVDDWAKNDSSIKSQIETLNSLTSGGVHTLSSIRGSASGFSLSGGPINTAKGYFKAGLNAAVEQIQYMNNAEKDKGKADETEIKVSDTEPTKNINDDATVGTFEYTINIKGFDTENEKNEFYINDINPKTLADGKIKLKIEEIKKVSGGTISLDKIGANIRTELAKKDQNQDLIIKVKIEADDDTECEKKKDIAFTIDGKYKVVTSGDDDGLKNIPEKYRDKVITIWDNPGSTYQRFISQTSADASKDPFANPEGGDGEAKDGTFKIEGKVSLTDVCEACKEPFEKCIGNIDNYYNNGKFDKVIDWNDSVCSGDLLTKNCVNCEFLQTACKNSKDWNSNACKSYVGFYDKYEKSKDNSDPTKCASCEMLEFYYKNNSLTGDLKTYYEENCLGACELPIKECIGDKDHFDNGKFDKVIDWNNSVCSGDLIDKGCVNCDTLQEACKKSNNWSSNECKSYQDYFNKYEKDKDDSDTTKCVSCEFLEKYRGSLTGELKTYYENNCAACETKKQACEASSGWGSTECNDLFTYSQTTDPSCLACDYMDFESLTDPDQIQYYIDNCPAVCTQSLKDACKSSGSWTSDECQKADSIGCVDCNVLLTFDATLPADAKTKYNYDTKCKDPEAPVEITCNEDSSKFNCCDENDNELLVSFDDDIDSHDPDGTPGNNGYTDVYVVGPGEKNKYVSSVKACFVDPVNSAVEARTEASKIKLQNSGTTTDEDGDPLVAAPGTNKDIDILDQKSNKYTLQDSAGASIVINDNKYCSVYCKEDYLMVMPTARITSAGRYFTFRAKINGTKACYSSKVNRERFNWDVAELEKEMIDAYNEYKDWEAALNKFNSGGLEEQKVTANTSYTTSVCNRCNYSSNEVTNGYKLDWTFEAQKITNKSASYVNSKTDYHRTGLPTTTTETRNTTNTIDRTISVPMKSNTISTGGCSVWATPPATGCAVPCTGSGTCTIVDGPMLTTNLQTLKDQIKKDIEDKKKAAKERLDALKIEIEDLIAKYNECDDWQMYNLRNDIELEYNYDGKYAYYGKISNLGEMTKASSSSTGQTEWYCSDSSGNSYDADVDDKYESCTGSNAKDEKPVKFKICYTTGCVDEDKNLSTVRYKKIEEKSEDMYMPTVLAYNVHPTGDIEGAAGANSNVLNGHIAMLLANASALASAVASGDVTLPSGYPTIPHIVYDDNQGLLPVPLDSTPGSHQYTISFKGGLGEKNYYSNSSDSTLERYMGGSNSILSSTDYLCSYLVNTTTTTGWDCPFDDQNCKTDCISQCVGPGCGGDCDGNDCVAACIGIGCIYDSKAGSSLIEKNVSLNNLFPNGTESYNWDARVNKKAAQAIGEIQGKGNKIYDESSNEPILKLTITPSARTKIIEYNKNDANGDYGNNTMSCINYGDHQNIWCTSSFIDSIVGGAYNVINVQVTPTRSGSGYFTPYTGVISDLIMVGPAYK